MDRPCQIILDRIPKSFDTLNIVWAKYRRWRVNKVYATYKNLYDSSVAIVFLLFTWNQRHDSFVVLLVWDDILNTAISMVLNSDPL